MSRNWLTALPEGDTAYVLKHPSADIVWKRTGKAPVRAKPAVRARLEQLKPEAKRQMIIGNILTHKAGGAAGGTMRLKNGRSYGFCRELAFQSPAGRQLRRITSFEFRQQPMARRN